MARDFSKISPRVFKSAKFWALPDSDTRVAYFYFLAGSHANAAGCYECPPAYLAADLRMSVGDAAKAIDSLSEVGLIAYDRSESTVWVENWFTFNPPTNAKHAQGILRNINEQASDAMKGLAAQALSNDCKDRGFRLADEFFDELERLHTIGYGKGIESLSKAYRYTETETETETETQTGDRDRDRDGFRNTEPRVRESVPSAHAGKPAPGAALPDGAPQPQYEDPRLQTPTMQRAKLKS